MSARRGSFLARLAAVFLALWCVGPLVVSERYALQRLWGPGGARLEAVRQWASPRAGENVLAPATRGMIALLRERGVTSFRTSQGLRHADPSVQQRLAEGAYPIVQEAHAPTLLLMPGEPLPSGCRLVESRAEAVLADCR